MTAEPTAARRPASVVAIASLGSGETRTGTNADVSRFRRKLPPPAIQKARVDTRAARDLAHHGARLVHRRDKPSLLRRAPAPATLDRRDDLNAIHGHVANLVLATGPTPVPRAHKAARPGRVRYCTIVSQTNSKNASFSAQCSFGPPHLLCDLRHRRSRFRMCLELPIIVLCQRHSIADNDCKAKERPLTPYAKGGKGRGISRSTFRIHRREFAINNRLPDTRRPLVHDYCKSYGSRVCVGNANQFNPAGNRSNFSNALLCFGIRIGHAMNKLCRQMHQIAKRPGQTIPLLRVGGGRRRWCGSHRIGGRLRDDRRTHRFPWPDWRKRPS